MIAEIGHAALWLALITALLQGVLPLVGAQRGDSRLINFAAASAHTQALLCAISFAALTWCFVVSDFSVLLVVTNSHTLKPMLYKITGVWANHEGSLLLWVLILALAGSAVARFGRSLPKDFLARVLAVQALVALGFYAFLLITSNPFARIDPAPEQGNGLNPLLQDPGLAFHPPMLYVGYVGLSVTFSFAAAALLEGRIGPTWARWVRPWTLFAWASLTLGIALGSWWAYYELGWGGWWFWDPVENASLMPWLAATALFHSAIVLEKRDALKSWTVLLAILAFSLSMLGTFIVRSGVLTSVHAFAVDPERGMFILLLLALYIGGALGLYAWRAGAMESGGAFRTVSREGGLVLNNLLLSACLGTVFIGTLYPLALEAFTGKVISVGPPYFNSTFIPLMVPLMLAMAMGPFLAWRQANAGAALAKLIPAAIATACVLVLLYALYDTKSALGLLGFALTFALGFGVLTEMGTRLRWGEGGAGATFARLTRIPPAAWGMILGHLGVAITAFGVTASEVWRQETLTTLRIGQSASMGNFQFDLRGVEPVAGPNFTAIEATIHVERNGALVGDLFPQARHYANPVMETTEAAIHPLWNGDLYAVIGEADGKGGWAVRLHFKPFVPLIWFGAGLMAMGALVSMGDRRLRVRREQPAPVPNAQPVPAE
jgi:cytochrome c-type biogenesis protein CcmF